MPATFSLFQSEKIQPNTPISVGDRISKTNRANLKIGFTFIPPPLQAL